MELHATQLDTATLASYILHVLSESQLNTEYCISQCYDRASVMRGTSSGVSAKIRVKQCISTAVLTV